MKEQRASQLSCLSILMPGKAETAFFSADELNAVSGDFDESEFVRKTVGTGNVCERAAVLAGGGMIIRKTVENSVTVAAAAEDWRITF